MIGKLKFLRTAPAHLFLFPLLFLINHFYAIVGPDDITKFKNINWWILNTIGAIALCCLPLWLTYRLLRRWRPAGTAGVTSTLMFSPIFFFQDFFSATEQILGSSPRVAVVLPMVIVATVAICVFVWRVNSNVQPITEFLNVLSLVLMAYLLPAWIFAEKPESPPASHQREIKTYSVEESNYPDIYFFILDSYTSNKSLQRFYDYDNSDQIHALQELGFYVSSEQKSMYDKTQYSVAATLNFGRPENIDQLDEATVGELIKSSSVAATLHQYNYEPYGLSLFKFEQSPEFYSIKFSLQPDFVDGVFQNSIFGLIVGNIFIYKNLYTVHMNILEEVTRIAHQYTENPKFVYAHLMAPHTPFVIDSSGQQINLIGRGANVDKKKAYVAQVMGVNKLIRPVLESILSTPRNKIIIIQGDHGSRFIKGADGLIESKTVFFAAYGVDPAALGSMSNSHEIFTNIFVDSLKRTVAR